MTEKIYEVCESCGNRFVGSFKRKHCYDKECINKRANISYHKCKKKKDDNNCLKVT